MTDRSQFDPTSEARRLKKAGALVVGKRASVPDLSLASGRAVENAMAVPSSSETPTAGVAMTGQPAIPSGVLRRMVATLRSRRAAVVASQALFAVIVVFAWQYLSDSGLINPVFYSSPSKILNLLGHQLAGQTVHGLTLYQQTWVTAEEVLIGYAIGSTIGIALGFAIGRSKLLMRAFEPYVLTFYAVPKISIAPLFVVILGVGLTSKVAIVVIESFFILFYNTFRGVLQVNEELVQLARIMGAPRHTVVLRVLLPASLPSVAAGLQLAAPFAVIGAVIGEYVSSSRGLGWLVLYSGSTLDATQLFAAIAVLIVLTWVLTKVVDLSVRRLAPWIPSSEGPNRSQRNTRVTS